MSVRHRKLKRLRYYRRHPAILDKFAAEVGLEICGFTGDCDSCPEGRPEDVRTWASMCRGEVTEVGEYVCANCLPEYRRQRIDEWHYYGTRSFHTLHRHQERQWQIRNQILR